MSTVIGPKYTGTLLIDLSDVKDDLYDLKEGAMSRLRQEQDGMPGVVAELATAVPAHGTEVGIAPVVYDRVVAATATIAKLRAHQIELDKAAEVNRESLAKLMHDRENDLSTIVQTVKKGAKDQSKPELLAAFEKTIHYNAQAAEKAQYTKKKNAEAAAAAAGTPGNAPAAPATPPTPPNQGP
jgi:hypothetical protein